MARQLNLDRDKLDQCYEISAQIVSHAAKYLDRHSSSAIERATLILLGVEGEFRGTPLASLLVEKLTKDQLRLGAAYWWGRALLATKEEAPKVAEQLARGRLKWTDLADISPAEIRKITQQLADEGLQKMGDARKGAAEFFLTQRPSRPHFVLRIQEGKAKRVSSSIHDWSKKGIQNFVAQLNSKEFYKETWHAEELNLAWKNLKDVKAIVTTRGLSAPEQTLLALRLRLPAISLDGWIPILKGEIDAKRSLVDHSFALALCAKWPIKILGDTTRNFTPPQLLTTLLLFEQLARRKNFPFENIMLSTTPPAGGQAREFVVTIALAQVLREMFSQSPLWYRLSDSKDFFYFLVAAFTEQDVVEWEPQGESDFKLAEHWLKQTEGFGDEFLLNTHGKIGREAHLILDQTWKLLRHIHHITIWKSFEEGVLTTTPSPVVNLGSEGLFQKSYHYWNPVWQALGSS